MDSWDLSRAKALDSVEVLVELLEDRGSGNARLIRGYLEAKKALAQAFEAFANELYRDPAPLQQAREVIESAMSSNFSQVPAKYRQVKGFGDVHELLLAFFSRRVGVEVPVDEMRMLTGDAVHTERRARDLRDLGFQLDVRTSGGRSVYVLQSNVPNVEFGAQAIVRRNVREDHSLSPAERTDILDLFRQRGPI